ncbi:hypothetical protein TCAL_11113, partial [Tigriopus californicus]|eukprot:TCALIF_11113-PA protein Name:"Protein of unknown function" AED:0.08 eAED:0.09 QI:29/0/0/1/0/0/2/0/416
MSKQVNALFDKGCNNTTITTSLMRELKMSPSGPVENRTLNVMTGVKVPILSTPVEFQISGVNVINEFKKHGVSSTMIYTIKAHAIDKTCPSLTPLDWSEVLLREPHLQGIQLSGISKTEVQVVIGTDYAGLLTPLETRMSTTDMSAPTVELTRLGWVLMGKHTSKKGNYITSNLGYRANFDQDCENLPAMAERFWAVETPECNDTPWSKNEQLGYDKMVVSYDAMNKRFEASIPWKDGEKPVLPKNRSAVILRQKRSLRPSYLQRKGCTLGEINMTINDYEKKDRPFHRFVMIGSEGKIQDYEFQVQLLGNKAVPNISQKVLLENANLHGQELTLASYAMRARTYMDDIADSRDTEAEAIREIGELKKLLEFASMSPRKWLSNSKRVLKSVSPEDRSKNIVDLSSESYIPSGKILG